MQKTTRRAKDAPTAERAFAAVRSKPRALEHPIRINCDLSSKLATYRMIDGVYVVRGDHVENTQNVET
jgi:hypothetical protein